MADQSARTLQADSEGVSKGGYVSTVASARLQIDDLFLLKPTSYLNKYGNHKPIPRAKTSMIVRGRDHDDVPVQNSIRFTKLQSCDLHLLEGNHRLNVALPTTKLQLELFLIQSMVA